MRTAVVALLFCASLGAQSLTYYIDNSNGSLPASQLTQISGSYQLADTPVSSNTSLVIRAVNTSAVATKINLVFVSSTAGSTASTPNFSITGLTPDSTIAPQSFKMFTINFTPAATGALTGYLEALEDSVLYSVATLTGNGTPPELALSCASTASGVSQCNGNALTPTAAIPLYFGNVLTTSTLPITFTLSNGGASSINPQSLVSLLTATNNPNNPFSLSSLPSSISPGSSGTFTITFAPGATGTYQTQLVVGTNTYLLQGVGTSSVVGDISSLIITYTDSTGVRLTAQPATAISFGQIVAGGTGSAALTFTVTNPQTTISAVAVPNLTVSGSNFTLSGAPALPATIQPGASLSFQVVFSASAVGTYPGSLTVGTRQFPLTGQSITSPLPDVTFQLDASPLTSQQQVHLSVQVASASPVSAIGQLSLTFAPSVSGISDDPAIVFTATNGRTLQLSVANGATSATSNNQSSFTLQTGTTAGTLTFTVTFPNKAPYSKSFTISPAQVAITSGKAQGQTPNLVVTLTGYDNTYSTGQLSFNFYDTNGNLLTPKGVPVDATSAFHQYFFTNDQAGGAFSVQASFPVKGIDVTKVAKTTVTLTNSAGTTSTTQTFQ